MNSIASPALSATAPAGTSPLFPTMARTLLVLVTAAGVTAGLLATGTEAAASAIALAGADLTYLLRAMALLKVIMAAGAMAAVWWRFGSPVMLAWWAAYALACVGMAMGLGLIWQMAYVRTGALLLHAGLFAALILLWRDPAVGARLGAMIAGICSTRLNDGFPLQDSANCLICIDSASCCGTNNRSNGSEKIGTPI